MEGEQAHGEESSRRSGEGRHALIVNDDHIQLALIACLLVEEGWTVTRHARAEAALSVLQQSSWLPDLIITDLYLPGMDGGSFIRLLRSKAYKRCNAVPMLVVSATFSGMDTAKINRALGANAMLPIPFSKSDFKEQVRAIMAGEETLKKATFLIIDDDDAYVELVRHHLNDNGYDVISKRPEEDVIAFCERAVPEVILLDYHPPMDDSETLLELIMRKNPQASVIMLSGTIDFELAASWLAKGARAYCQKSMGHAYLLALCEKILREKLFFDIELLLEKRTHELRRINDELQKEIDVRREAEQRLQEQAQLLTATLDGIRDVITILAPDRRILTMNKAGLSFFKKPKEAFADAKCYDLYGRPGPCEICHLEEVLRERKLITIEKFVPEINAWIELNSTPLFDDKGEVSLVIQHIRDITARKKAEERRLEEQKRLAQASKMTAMGTLVAGVGHEINNPASFITLNAPLLKKFLGSALPILDEHVASSGDFIIDNTPYSEVREHIPSLINGIVNGGQRISKIVASLKEFSHPTDGCARQEVDINEVITKSVELLKDPIRKATAHFVFDPTPNLPKLRNADPCQLEQVFVNLLLNAAQALPGPDKGMQVQARFNAAEDVFELDFSDEGVGIPRDHLERATDPFFTTKVTKGGMGLGLSISHNIVKEHGGRLELSSEVGKGTTVRVILPVDALSSVATP